MIDEDVILGKKNKFGEYTTIKGNVKIGDNNYFGNNTVIEGNCEIEIGDNNYFSDFCSVGKYPQHMIKKLELNINNNNFLKKKKIQIGSNNVFREFITIHTPFKSNITSIGSNCYLMDYCHIAHDCIIFDNVNISNNCQIGGHSIILNNTTIGLSVTIHQFSTVGSFCMIGMGTVITKDIPPFLLVFGNPVRKISIDNYGLKKHGFDDLQIKEINNFYQKSNNIPNNDCINNEVEKFLKYSTRDVLTWNKKESSLDTKAK